ncbi:hypothetical protein LTR78_003343 [Recurvomyces mirabilis]|uniref:MFS general substrate transporter n=1 Tax=Recurvomyces mirabilis TaxID=574656 RepID=A0AAE0WS11_9PEZI|nr:hypothetical protein LTR78_003343 [Recurvomyces mirabilis]KAK5154621.1 hypothetical protein LTS14_006759 [Recurvomyces mirabilis]
METSSPRRGSANVSASALDHWRSHSPTGSERRKLSYHPTDPWDLPLSTTPDSTPAVNTTPQTSSATRILQVSIAVLYCLLAAGPVFGFAAIKPVLVHEGVYRDQCTPQEVKDKVWVCYGQELRLNLMFTVAAVSTNVCALPVGTVLDRYGPKIASLVGVVLLTLGALFMAFAQDLPFDAYIPGYLFLALGGPFVFISSFQLSNTFPAHSGFILALLTGAFDTSSAVFLVYRLIYQQTDSRFTPKKFFLIYLIVPALILLAQLLVMPSQSYTTASETSADVNALVSQVDMDTEATGLLKKHNSSDAKAQDTTVTRSGVWGALHGRTALQQIMTPWFILIALFTLLQMTRINYFVATLRTQYTHLLHSRNAAIQLNNFFDVALPLGGVAAVPLIGLVLDHTSTTFVLALLVGVATTIGILGIVPEMWAGYANIVLFVLYRPLYYTAVSDYSAKVFGFETFGKVYGLIICLAGLFNFSQQGLDTLTHGVLKGDPVPVNVGLLITAFLVGVVLVGFVWRKSYTMQRDKLEEEAEGAREVQMPADLDTSA